MKFFILLFYNEIEEKRKESGVFGIAGFLPVFCCRFVNFWCRFAGCFVGKEIKFRLLDKLPWLLDKLPWLLDRLSGWWFLAWLAVNCGVLAG